MQVDAISINFEENISVFQAKVQIRQEFGFLENCGVIKRVINPNSSSEQCVTLADDKALTSGQVYRFVNGTTRTTSGKFLSSCNCVVP